MLRSGMEIRTCVRKTDSMTTPVIAPSPTPALGADPGLVLSGLRAAIDGLQAQGTPLVRGPQEYDALLIGYDREIRRLQALKLAVVAAADAARVAEQAGLSDTSAWFARRTRSDGAAASREVGLATALATTPGQTVRPCAQALASGELSADHARVIVAATGQLPSGLTSGEVTTVEEDLVEKAGRLSPDHLRRVARRALAAVEEDQAIVDRHEDDLLRTEEDGARSRTKLTLHDNGDGTTTGHFTVPTVAASILRKVIQSMTSPRRARLGATAAQAGDPTERRDWSHQAGHAFADLLGRIPTDHLHHKVAATVLVTIEHDHLRDAVGAAGLDTGDSLSASETLRLACGAGIAPVVLNGPGLPLHLGRTQRFFNEAQRVVLATRHHTCIAEGCERPFAWCELHHRKHWAHRGTSNLEDADPLCGFHHQRIHDPRYTHTRGPNGVTFRLRT